MPETNETKIETFIWKGQTRYRCPGHWESGAKCEFDCASMEQMAAHMRTPHLRAAPTSIPAAPPAAVPVSVEDTEASASGFGEAKFAPVSEDASD